MVGQKVMLLVTLKLHQLAAVEWTEGAMKRAGPRRAMRVVQRSVMSCPLSWKQVHHCMLSKALLM